VNQFVKGNGDLVFRFKVVNITLQKDCEFFMQKGHYFRAKAKEVYRNIVVGIYFKKTVVNDVPKPVSALFNIKSFVDFFYHAVTVNFGHTAGDTSHIGNRVS